MRRMVAAIDSLPQHFVAIRERPQVYRPQACPHCGFGRLWRHGCYGRKADRESAPQQSLNPTPVLRFCCVGCRRTCSRLPCCLSPRRWYDWAMQQRALLALLLGGALRQCSAQLGPARSTLRRWRDWLVGRHAVFAVHLRSRFPELGRAPDQPTFWSDCFQQMTLANAMAWLDQQLTVP